MRTTLDLPDDLMKRAKIAAVERGMTLRDLVAEGLRQALAGKKAAPTRARLKLPAVKVPDDAPILKMSTEEIKQIMEDEDIERDSAIPRRR